MNLFLVVYYFNYYQNNSMENLEKILKNYNYDNYEDISRKELCDEINFFKTKITLLEKKRDIEIQEYIINDICTKNNISQEELYEYACCIFSKYKRENNFDNCNRYISEKIISHMKMRNKLNDIIEKIGEDKNNKYIVFCDYGLIPDIISCKNFVYKNDYFQKYAKLLFMIYLAFDFPIDCVIVEKNKILHRISYCGCQSKYNNNCETKLPVLDNNKMFGYFENYIVPNVHLEEEHHDEYYCCIFDVKVLEQIM